MSADDISGLSHGCAVYMLASPSRSLYVGAITDLERRGFEHKTQYYPESHTVRYRINRLVWWEACADWEQAHMRELEIKGWIREKKSASDSPAESGMAGSELRDIPMEFIAFQIVGGSNGSWLDALRAGILPFRFAHCQDVFPPPLVAIRPQGSTLRMNVVD